MSWEFGTDPEYREKLDWALALVEGSVYPLETLELDEAAFRVLIAPLQKQVKEAGLWAAHLDLELGGQGFGQLKLGLLNEVVGRSKLAPYVFGSQAPDAGNAEILARFGTPQQRTEFLLPLLAGEWRSAYAMTEPVAGADPTLLRTSAVLDGDHWVLNGRKWFITNASVADFFIVMAVSDPGADRHHRATQFIVPAGRPGLRVLREPGSIEDPNPIWGRSENHAQVELVDVRVTHDSMLGGRGEGFAIAQSRLGPGRIHHCMRWVGQAQRALDMMCERSTYRFAHGSVLADKQQIQVFIADSWTELNALRLMTLQAAWIIDTQGVSAARAQISAIKYWGAKVLHDVIDRAVQVHGALGYSGDLPLEEMYRRARAARIYDGPDEVHRVSVAKQVLRGYRPPADGIPTEHVPTRYARARQLHG
jgi:acyl-CoA dehydrogenase